MSYELRDHTADIAVEASAPTLSSLFEALAAGFTAASCTEDPGTGDRFSLEVRAEGREALLFDYLDQLVYERDVRSVLPADHDCTVHEPTTPGGAWMIEASARGIPLSDVAAREIKAVTYSEMTLEKRDGEWYGYVVFDV